MNLLIDGLPDSVEIAGQMIPIDTSFRTGILFEELMLDDAMDPVEKLATALDLYYPGTSFAPEVQQDAVRAMLWFYRCGADEAPAGEGHGQADAPPYSYEYDADYIYAAFLGAFGVDLARSSLHWWQFRALFKSLPEDTQFIKIIGYRTMSIPAKMPKDQKQHYQKMKKLYALPASKDRQQLESDLTQLLMNGGNPSALM